MYVLDLTGKPRTMGRVVMFGAGGGYGIRHSSTSGMTEIWSLTCGKDCVTKMVKCVGMYERNATEQDNAYAEFERLTQ